MKKATVVSLPTRGAWIEIRRLRRCWGDLPGRSPHGERGLKSEAKRTFLAVQESLPTRGAWIEI